MQTTERQHHELEALNLDRYLRKLASREPDQWSAERLQLAAREYRRFLRLRQLHPDVNLVPTLLMDAVWHEHILHTRHYGPDMHRIMGYFLHHCPEYPGDESTHNLQSGLAVTIDLYRRTFGDAPAEAVSARCDGKKCHAPTPCRCR